MLDYFVQTSHFTDKKDNSCVLKFNISYRVNISEMVTISLKTVVL